MSSENKKPEPNLAPTEDSKKLDQQQLDLFKWELDENKNKDNSSTPTPTDDKDNQPNAYI